MISCSYNVTAEQLFDLFGKFGPIRQIRQGIANNSKGTAFVVYEDVHDAKQACDKLNGFNFQNRYLVGRCRLVTAREQLLGERRIFLLITGSSVVPPAGENA
jgi:hypothetical protein